MTEEKTPSWGGRREGSGRKKTDRKARCITLTDEEYQAVKEFITKMRGSEDK